MYYLPPLAGATAEAVRVEPPGPGGVLLGTWKISGHPTPPPPVPEAQFPPDLELLRAEARPEGSAVRVSLEWLARQRPVRNYTVFVQALSGSGAVLAQHDSYPLDGRYPTSLWSAG